MKGNTAKTSITLKCKIVKLRAQLRAGGKLKKKKHEWRKIMKAEASITGVTAQFGE